MAVAQVDTETGEILSDGRNKENRDFVMLYRHYIFQLSELGMQDVQALRVLLFLVKHMDTKNALVAPMSLMSEMLGVSRQTVSQKIKYLQDNGWIAVGKVGRQNVYIVNPDVVWTAYGDQKKYCKFEASVLMDGADNWDLIRSDDKLGIRHIDRQVIKDMADKEFPNG